MQRDELRKLLFQGNLQAPASFSNVINQAQGNDELGPGTLKKIPNESSGVLNNLTTITTQRVPAASVVRESDDLVRHKAVREEDEDYKDDFEGGDSAELASTKKPDPNFKYNVNANRSPRPQNEKNLQDIDNFLRGKQQDNDISIEEIKF